MMVMETDFESYPVNHDHPNHPRTLAWQATIAANEASRNSHEATLRPCPLGCKPLLYYSKTCRIHDDCPLAEAYKNNSS